MRNTKRFCSRFVVAWRTARSLICDSCCQAHIASSPAEGWHGEHARERRREQEVRLVDLQRDADALGGGLLLLVGEGGVEAAQQPCENLDGVAFADAAAGTADDEDVAGGDDVVQRALVWVVQHAV